MTLTHKPITFASIKVYCLSTLICPIILISHIAELLICKFYCFCKGLHISSNMRDIIIYVAWWWQKYLSKRSPLKHTCSWRDKLIVLWILNRHAKIKIFLCRNEYICFDFFEVWSLNFSLKEEVQSGWVSAFHNSLLNAGIRYMRFW